MGNGSVLLRGLLVYVIFTLFYVISDEFRAPAAMTSRTDPNGSQITRAPNTTHGFPYPRFRYINMPLAVSALPAKASMPFNAFIPQRASLFKATPSGVATCSFTSFLRHFTSFSRHFPSKRLRVPWRLPREML